MRPIDSLDQRILRELRRNARIPLATLGSRVQLSRNAVRKRMERLERDGFIHGYTIVEHEPRARPVASAYLLVDRLDRMRGAAVLATLRRIPEVVLCDVLSGEFDLFVRIEARSVGRIQQIWQEIADHPGVRDTTTAVTLSTEIRRLFSIEAERDGGVSG